MPSLTYTFEFDDEEMDLMERFGHRTLEEHLQAHAHAYVALARARQRDYWTLALIAELDPDS